MKQKAVQWEVVISLTDDSGNITYARLSHRNRITWTKRTAQKHAREYKSQHLQDAWAQDAMRN